MRFRVYSFTTSAYTISLRLNLDSWLVYRVSSGEERMILLCCSVAPHLSLGQNLNFPTANYNKGILQ